MNKGQSVKEFEVVKVGDRFNVSDSMSMLENLNSSELMELWITIDQALKKDHDNES